MLDFKAPAKVRICRSESRKCRVMEPDAWERITFLYRKVKSGYFRKINSNILLQHGWEEFLKSIHFHIENRSEWRKRINPIAVVRSRIAPADATALRCNHSTSHVPSKKGRERVARGSGHAENTRNCSETICLHKISEVGTPTKMQIVRSKNRKFQVMELDAWECITFLFPNIKV